MNFVEADTERMSLVSETGYRKLSFCRAPQPPVRDSQSHQLDLPLHSSADGLMPLPHAGSNFIFISLSSLSKRQQPPFPEGLSASFGHQHRGFTFLR